MKHIIEQIEALKRLPYHMNTHTWQDEGYNKAVYDVLAILNSAPVDAQEEKAIAFAEWCMLPIRSDKYGILTTEQLYNLFIEQNQKK